ncbi:hypothetical protein A8B82_05825 [Sulfitobacter sp. EhC04]|uniref:hypothetical protein n=1 Tax=Sulfitobacter sp. EhC04 TaxID=1849168 RepID=UPI0007F3BDC5|nr:hypothetical protein [Sulfitobacter sp. EhC04]OAN67735.1 hypothetical protein A8B82_05825 [Sulfitobacter sp. EhC04]
MARMKEILTVAGTLACAIGIGFVMQNSDAAKARYGKHETPAPKELEETATSALLDVQQIKLTSGEFKVADDLPATPAISASEPDATVIKVRAPQSVLEGPPAPGSAAPASACAITAEARAMAAAMVDLRLDAVCLPNERVTVHHNGMIFTETTDANGKLNTTVPALARDAMFILAFGNGDGAVAQTQVDELVDYDRALVQWKGNAGFEIHAREFGANYGDAGHHWKDAPGAVADAVIGRSGVLTRHGDAAAADPLLAEVYTFPRAESEQVGTIALSVEAEVTKANCGVEAEAQSLQLMNDGQIKSQDLILSVPECDAVGSFLVLNNLLQDLKVAGK